MRKIKVHMTSLLITIFLFVFILPTRALVTSTNYLETTINPAYGQPDQMNSNATNFVNIQNIPIKKIHVGDIDIAYKMFGKGEPILLISGSARVMDHWSSSVLQDLSSNHTVIIFDNRGVGNTTFGTKPFSIQQFTNDTVGLLDALKIQKADVLGFSMGSFVAQGLTLMHPEKVNRLILYAASCGGQEGIPQSPQVVKVWSDFFINNRTQDPLPLLSTFFSPEWIRQHPDFLKTIPNTTEKFLLVL
ncbi:MAG TPA: alpha/beta hydrolase [Nitrososphaeraceae archaeon]|nr:alpha/beta hydrolase [Nitrososphaeraceae archaeon]